LDNPAFHFLLLKFAAVGDKQLYASFVVVDLICSWRKKQQRGLWWILITYALTPQAVLADLTLQMEAETRLEAENGVHVDADTNGATAAANGSTAARTEDEPVSLALPPPLRAELAAPAVPAAVPAAEQDSKDSGPTQFRQPSAAFVPFGINNVPSSSWKSESSLMPHLSSYQPPSLLRQVSKYKNEDHLQQKTRGKR
jgi:hypothetical protein